MSANAVRPPGYLPKTFLEWGVAVPFTTPMFSSGQIRPGRRGQPEMLLPNPSGGRGLYVFDLGAAPELTSLTLHDRLLLERLLELPAPTPSEIRKAARAIASEGAAGRRAAREADAAESADAAVGLLIQLHLVTRLLQDAGLEGVDWRQFTGDNRELRSAIKARLGAVAPSLGLSVDGVFHAIEEIAEVATPVGTAESPSANEAMLGRLGTFSQSLRQWSVGETAAAATNAAMLCNVADRTLTEATTAQTAARELLAAASLLLRGWHVRSGEAMRGTLTRPEWLLDGWAQICGLWEVAVRDERAVQRETLEQIRSALPLLDPTDRDVTATRGATDVRFDRGRRVRLHEDWRTGATLLDSRARSELLRAATA